MSREFVRFKTHFTWFTVHRLFLLLLYNLIFQKEIILHLHYLQI